jgi:hypothetical protein
VLTTLVVALQQPPPPAPADAPPERFSAVRAFEHVQAIAQEHPWAVNVEVLINFDARGNRGPVYMFETSPHNGRLIQTLARAAPRPLATSLMF